MVKELDLSLQLEFAGSIPAGGSQRIRVEPHFATIRNRLERIRGGRDYLKSKLDSVSVRSEEIQRRGLDRQTC